MADRPVRYCTRCGEPLAADDRFCGACGAPVPDAIGVADGTDPGTGPWPTDDEAPTAAGVDAGEGRGGLRQLSGLTLVTVGFAMAALLVGALAIVLWLDEEEPARTITGAVTAIDEGYAGRVGEPCGVGSEDFRPSVTVVAGDDVDGDGTTVQASDGRIAQLFQCRFTYAVAGLPDADVYQLILEGGEARQVTRDELEAAGWQVDFSLGGLGG